MKKNVLFFFLLAGSSGAFSQKPFPDCSQLLVEAIAMDDDTASLMKITLKNNCSNCAAGINGCVYVEMKVIRTVAPFDTLVASDCYCLWLPDNNNRHIYLLENSAVTVLPPFNQFRVSTRTCGCDTIPFSQALLTGLTSYGYLNEMTLHALSQYTFRIDSGDNSALQLSIWNVSGKSLHETDMSNALTINIEPYPPGLYLFKVTHRNSGAVKVFKVIHP